MQNISIWITDDSEVEDVEYFLVVVESNDPRCVPGRPANVTIDIDSTGESYNI